MMSQFTFDSNIEFPAPGSQLHTIAQNGIVPLFKFWTEQLTDFSSNSVSDWASTATFLKYVQNCYQHNNLMMVDHESSADGVVAVTELLNEANGIYYFVFNELYSSSDNNMSFVVDFVDSDRITVATTNGQPIIFCQDFDRVQWTTNFIKDFEAYRGGVFTLVGTSIDLIKIMFEI